MRPKQTILNDIQKNILKAPPEGQAMLCAEYCYIEVLLDIRDLMAADMKTALAISKVISKRKGGKT